MEILLAANAGFCFGVKRAINMAFEAAENCEGEVYTLGPIIHNPQVVEKLGSEGVKSVNDLPSEGGATLIVRTHGVPPAVMEEAQQRFNVIDATCPFVKKAQEDAHQLAEEGYQVVLVGDKGHPEVTSIMGSAGKGAVVVESAEELKDIRLKKRIGVIVQTTQSFENLAAVVTECLARGKVVKVFNTICNSTTVRQEATRELARKVDLMLVVGGRNSANTTRLTTICLDEGKTTYHIEVPEEIREEWLEKVEKVGITAGASTPEWIINGVVEKLKELEKSRATALKNS
ncbi:MAG: 4-hydroxy-3-methylbut-2-enyl diphosphate reductase [Nitrospirota bacterium]|nr:4-hydroxy-3-methylbut-2-enyl diphosphate reductase [Nitrospirota bacterium]